MLEGSLGNHLHMLGTAIHLISAFSSIQVDVEPELGCDHYLASQWRERLTNQLFIYK